MAIVLAYSFTGEKDLNYNDLSLLLHNNDPSGIESAGYSYWKTESDGFIGYQSNNFRDQIWVKPSEEIHVSSETLGPVTGRLPENISIERYSDGPMCVLFVYPKGNL